MGDKFDIGFSSWQVHCSNTNGPSSEFHSANIYCKGDAAVYRLSFVQTMFFGVMAAMSYVSSRWHRGYWGFKLMAILFGSIVVFFIPNSFFDNSGYAWVARVGSLVFIGLQMLLLIDVAYNSSSVIVERAFPSDGGDHDKKYIFGLLFTSILLYSTMFMGIPFIFANYPEYVFVSSQTLTLICILTSCTMLRHILTGDDDMRGEILPAAIVSAYMMYLLWSSLSDSHDEHHATSPKIEHLKFIVGAVFSAISLMYTAFTTSTSYDEYSDYNLAEPLIEEEETQKDGSSDETSNKRNAVFHIIMMTASMHTAMLITNWGINEYNRETSDSLQNGNLVVKTISQWVVCILYIWSLFAPAILTDREFD